MDHEGLGETVGRCLGLFYAHNGMFVSRISDWLQHTMNVLVGLFIKYVLAANVTKSRIMTCHPGALRAGMSEEAMALKCTGVGDSYQVRLRRRIPFPECGVELTSGSMMAHRCRMHGTEPSIDYIRLLVSQIVHSPQLCCVSFPRTKKQCPLSFPVCLGSSCTWNGLHSHFNKQH